MDGTLLSRLVSGQKDFLAEAKGRILDIDQAIKELAEEKGKLEVIVQLYEPLNPEQQIKKTRNTARVQSESDPLKTKTTRRYVRRTVVDEKRPSRISLDNQILNAFRDGSLVLAHHSQIGKFLGNETPHDKNAHIRRTLNNLKIRGLLTSHTIKRVHSHGHLVNTALYGLPEVFSDIEGEKIKPEFEDAKNQSLRDLDFSVKESDS
jgi:hypothetical protein